MGEAWSLKDTCASGEVSPQRQEDRQKLRARELTHTRCTLTASERSSPCCSNSECFLRNVHGSKHTHHTELPSGANRRASDGTAAVQRVCISYSVVTIYKLSLTQHY